MTHWATRQGPLATGGGGKTQPATVQGAAASGDSIDLRQPFTVTVDLSGVASGTVATLYFDLAGFGADDSSVVLTSLALQAPGRTQAPKVNR